MILTKILGNLDDEIFGKIPRNKIDFLPLDYDEARKRILRLRTEGGRDISLRLCPGDFGRGLGDGDVLLQEDDRVVAVKLLPMPVLVMRPRSLMETARLCYEVGNRHAPLYALSGEASAFAVLYDAAMESLMYKLGVPYNREALPLEERRRLKLQGGTHHHVHAAALGHG